MKSGYLTKSPPEGRIGQWQKRWFVFADSHRAYPLAPRYVRMEYYQSAEDAEMCRNPKGGSVYRYAQSIILTSVGGCILPDGHLCW